tara:strand:+ start:364 stop:720 length:357 start_codon:yes stop_codon:yes gene_type:complete
VATTKILNMYYNRKLHNLLEDFQDSVWHDFHDSDINSQDDFYEYLHNFIDNAVIYTYECEEILEGNSDYHYLEHDIYSRPTNIAQAAYACLYDYLQEEGCLSIWNEMEEVLNKEKQTA